ncbi:zinc-binding dehydrogenase [Ferrovibrio sp.]|uniref:zinc-binding dehydrogenase n=1 Tax=Ferrovibrio sp. TaxID=1917215 RepID=UPI003D27D124
MTLAIPKSLTAAVLVQTGQPLEIIDNIAIPELKQGQILVRVHYAGLCHSQVMETRGARGEDRYLPHMLGHEGTGTVLALGQGVSKVQVGQRVVLGWIKGQGIEAGGTVYLAADGRKINAGGVTTFSDYTIVSENRVVPLPEGSPDDLGVLYGCALPTGAGIVFNELMPTAQSSIAVLGLGGIGLSALLAARDFAPRLLVAVDIEDAKLELARRFGATHVVNAAREDPVAAVKALTGGQGVDYAIEAGGLAHTIEQGFAVIRRGGGRLVFASHPKAGDMIRLDPFELISGKSIAGSWGGGSRPDADVPRLGRLYAEGKLPLRHMLSHTYSLAEINRALEDLEARRIVRALIDFGVADRGTAAA